MEKDFQLVLDANGSKNGIDCSTEYGASSDLLNKVWLFGLDRPTKHRVIAATDIDNPKFEVVLLPTVRASSFLHDFLDRYLFAIAFHQLRHRNIGCVTALAFK